MTKLIVGSFLFCAIFHGVSFGIKKGEFMQNPVNTPQKIGEPQNLIAVEFTQKAKFYGISLFYCLNTLGLRFFTGS